MRKVRILLIAMMAIFATISARNVEVHAEEATKLVVHYHRFDPNYAGWNLWLWQNQPASGDGAAYNFTGDDAFGKVMELELTGTPLEGSTRVGVIVRTNAWDKDVAIDRFIDMTSPNASGEVHVYLVSGDPTIYYSPDGIDISNRASNVNFSSTTQVEFDTSKIIDASAITFKEDGTTKAISNFSISGTHVTFTVPEIDLSKVYSLIIDFDDAGYDPKEYSIGFSGLYATAEFNSIYGYDGELGAIYSSDSTTFKLWAPISESVSLNLYEYGHRAGQEDYDGTAGTDTPYATHDLTLGGKGVWSVTVSGDLHGVYYTFDVTNSGVTNEVSDPYAFSAGINGLRSMVVDFDSINPEGWNDTAIPNTIESYNDSIIYELHVRDFTTHSSWNGTEAYRGKFLGLTETGTTYNGVSTGLDHLIELGVTHVQLLPVFDFGAAVDETRLLDPSYSGVKDTVFNWGYMPENFNAVEGSYSTDPYDGSVRITEFKELIQTFHENGMRVVMDVVYNHHGRSADSNFDLIVPGYYFRMTESGSFSNGSGTGNETASEHYMMSKFIVDSVAFWADEYNVTGFRFDLMKLHDVDTMNAVVDAVHAIDETILVYGEPWTGGTSPLPESEAAYNFTLDEMPGVAVFNDDTRDGIKGSVFDEAGVGFIQATESSRDLDERLRLGIVGGVNHDDLTLSRLPKGAWAFNPNQTINYATAHDNNVLYDKLLLSTDGATLDQVKNMQKQAGAILLTSNGVPFLHAGIELMRTKPCTVIGGEAQGECDANQLFDHNSYRSPDSTNQIDWAWKASNMDVFNYYKGLIAIRRNTDVFSYDSLEELNSNLMFLQENAGIVSYFISDPDSPWEYTYVIHNNGVTDRNVSLQGMTWNLVVNRDEAGLETIEELSGTTVNVRENETLVMYTLREGAEWPPVAEEPEQPEEPENTGCFSGLTISASFVAIAALGGAALYFLRRK